MGLRNNFDICDGKNDITAILYLKVERGLFGQPLRWYVVYLPLFMKQLQPLSTPYLSITLPITMLPTVNKTEQYFIV